MMNKWIERTISDDATFWRFVAESTQAAAERAMRPALPPRTARLFVPLGGRGLVCACIAEGSGPCETCMEAR